LIHGGQRVFEAVSKKCEKRRSTHVGVGEMIIVLRNLIMNRNRH